MGGRRHGFKNQPLLTFFGADDRKLLDAVALQTAMALDKTASPAGTSWRWFLHHFHFILFDHLYLRFAMMAQAVLDLHGS